MPHSRGMFARSAHPPRAQPPTMQLTNDATLRAVRLRMSPPDRKTVAEIARDKGITAQTQYNWRSQWQMQGHLVLLSS
jgi:transposase-like protein